MPFDTRHAPGSHGEFVALVEEAVVAADPNNENVWIEWKSRLDLTMPDGKVALARAICGMANRLPGVAAPYCEGRAYVVVGAEPGKLHGISSVDPADLSNWLEPYLGRPGPRWQQHWTRTQNVDVLVVEINAPRQGDPIYPIRKEGPGVQNGQIFVRRPGKTVPATAEEIDDLVRRASARPEIRGVRLAVAEGTASPVDLSEAAQDQWLDTERDRCLESLREFQRQNTETKGGRHLGSFGTTRRKEDGLSIAEYERLIARRDAGEELTADEVERLNQSNAALNDTRKTMASFGLSLGTQVVPEARMPDEYEQEVAGYIERCRRQLPNLLDRAAAERLLETVCELHNDTGDNYPQVQVELHIPGAVVAFKREPPRAANEGRLPSPPRKYGPYRESLLPRWLGQQTSLSPMLYRGPSFEPLIADAGPTVEIDNRGSATLTFRPVDLRPYRSERLPPVVLAAQVPITIIQATWSATTTGASGVQSGLLEIPVHGKPWTVDDAVAAGDDEDHVG